MSQENVDLVRRLYEVSLARAASNFLDPAELAPEFWTQLAPDFELHERRELPDARVYRGPEEAKEFFRKTQDVFVEARWQPLDFIDLGHAIVVETRIVAVGRESDVPTEMEETDVFWFRDGMIVRLQGFATKEEALEAASRREQAVSQANVEFIRRLYQALDSRDLKSVEQLTHVDAEWIPDSRVGEGPIRGRQNVLKFFLDRAEMFGDLRTEVERVREAPDDKVLAFIRVAGHGGESGAGFEIRIAHLWTIRDGLVVRGEGYGDREEALEAAGLSQ